MTDHESAAGTLCTDDGDGSCRDCGVALTICEVCDGRGYHRFGCYESDEYREIAPTFGIDPVSYAVEEFQDAITHGADVQAIKTAPERAMTGRIVAQHGDTRTTLRSAGRQGSPHAPMLRLSAVSTVALAGVAMSRTMLPPSK